VTVAAATPVVHASGLTLRYGRTVALTDVSFTLHGGVTGLLGPNGAGKTTLLRIVATALSPDQGGLTVLGSDPRTPAGRLAVRRRLGYLPQDPGFHPGFTAFEFVDYVAILKELTDRRARHEEVRRVLDAVGMAGQRGRKIRALSGGMRQRVALAAALVGDPDLLILDEPTVGLDPGARRAVWGRLRDLQARLGTTVLLTTHDMEEAEALCARIAIMHRGKVVADGAPAALKASVGEGATLEDVFIKLTGGTLAEGGHYRDVARARSTAKRLG
jgi:ABC-2 type transport system ATP-binding protein